MEDFSLKECPTPEAMQTCETPAQAADYWRTHIATHPHFNPECECLVVLILNTRRKIKGHYFVSVGTMDTILVHPREVFRLAMMASASAIILMHNHPSNETNPSEADIKVTRDLIRGGQLLKIEVLDHIVIGNFNQTSLRESGYFYQRPAGWPSAPPFGGAFIFADSPCPKRGRWHSAIKPVGKYMGTAETSRMLRVVASVPP